MCTNIYEMIREKHPDKTEVYVTELTLAWNGQYEQDVYVDLVSIQKYNLLHQRDIIISGRFCRVMRILRKGSQIKRNVLFLLTI